MYISQPIGNILQKFNNQEQYVLYEPCKNLFDIHLAMCDLKMFSLESKHYIDTNLTRLNNDQLDLFNYSAVLSNDILAYAAKPKFSHMHINVGVFVHQDKISQIKKEDIILMNHKLKSVTKVFFNHKHMKNWNLSKSDVIDYGINTQMFHDLKETRNQQVLMFSENSSDRNIQILIQILQNHGVNVTLINEWPKSAIEINKLLNAHKIYVDLNPNNIINSLTGVACGCKVINYSYDQDIYKNVPNLIFVNDVNDLISTINKTLNESTNIDETHVRYIEENYSFIKFQENIKKITNNLIRETFYI